MKFGRLDVPEKEREVVLQNTLERGLLSSRLRRHANVLQAARELGAGGTVSYMTHDHQMWIQYLHSLPAEAFDDHTWFSLLQDKFGTLADTPFSEECQEELNIIDRICAANDTKMDFDGDPVLELTAENFERLCSTAFHSVRSDNTQPRSISEVRESDYPALYCLRNIVQAAINDTCTQLGMNAEIVRDSSCSSTGTILTASILNVYKKALLKKLECNHLSFMIGDVREQIATIFSVSDSGDLIPLGAVFQTHSPQQVFDDWKKKSGNADGGTKPRKNNSVLKKLFSKNKKRGKYASQQQKRSKFFEDLN